MPRLTRVMIFAGSAGRGVGPRQGQDLMALLQQLPCDGGPDKSGRARDKDLHRASFGQLDANPPPTSARARQRARIGQDLGAFAPRPIQ